MRLRGQVAAARGCAWDTQPSIGTWLGRAHRHQTPRQLELDCSENFRACRPGGSNGNDVFSELSIKGTCAKAFKLESIDRYISVQDLKVLCQPHCGLPPDQQRLFLKGRQLREHELLCEVGVLDKGTLFLVKGATSDELQKEKEQHRILQERQKEMQDRRTASMVWCFECGVNPGRMQTDGLCSICFREMVSREQAEWKRRKLESERNAMEAAQRTEREKREKEEWEARRQKDTSRCYSCHKKIGLTGFQCRCGYFFCATHRHAEDHSCNFDHKAYGQAGLTELLAPNTK